MKVHRDIEQGSPEWFQLRCGVITASKFKDVLAKGEGKTRKRYLLDLAGERLTETPAESYQNAFMERGKAQEAEARDLYCFQSDAEIDQIAFISNGDFGCSPDGLVGTDGLVEIKTRMAALQLECLLAEKLPSEHMAQVQGALWLSERAWCDYISYSPRLPLFVIRVERNEEYIDNLAKEVLQFNDEVKALVGKFS